MWLLTPKSTRESCDELFTSFYPSLPILYAEVLKATSHIVFGGIWWYYTQIKFWIPENIINTVKILGTANRTCVYSQYREIPSATIGNHVGTHQLPLESFSKPEYSNYPACTAVWQTWRVRAVQIPPKYEYTDNYCRLPRYLTVFWLPTSTTEYAQIPSNSIWELTLTLVTSDIIAFRGVTLPPSGDKFVGFLSMLLNVLAKRFLSSNDYVAKVGRICRWASPQSLLISPEKSCCICNLASH